MMDKDKKQPGYMSSWKNRPPQRVPQRTITIKGQVFDALNERRGEVSWSDYLCDIAGIPRFRDARRVERNTSDA